ncbi:ATP-binding protein [Thermodesulfobacteriota bacterium]
MIHSMRAFGYDLGMAVADLIDNSIFAKASNVWVTYDWNDGDPWIRILDDGRGMTEGRLVEAMRLGSTSPLDERSPEDLGRFGLGLKTASFSQCKLVTVHTKTDDGVTATRFWDLYHVEQTKEWKLGKKPDSQIVPLLQVLDDFERGTVVVWKNLDRVIDISNGHDHNPEETFLVKFLYVKEYLEMVFHLFLESRGRKLQIHVGAAECKPWDPYLRRNDFMQELSLEKYEDSRVKVVPYVLPHVSKRTPVENDTGGGPKGWNAQQGFYIYRNRRMIVSGGYLDFDLKPEEHYKLARIKVDITNDMDHEWSIDVRKAVSTPPDRLKKELLRIARVTRQRASEVYRARTGVARVTTGGGTTESNTVWLKRQNGEKIIYRLNRNNPVLIKLFSEINPGSKWISKLCHIIETTVPHRLIIMDGLEHEDCHVDLPRDLNPPPAGLMEMCLELYNQKLGQGRSQEEAVDIICSIEPFDSHPGYRATLDGLMEGD